MLSSMSNSSDYVALRPTSISPSCRGRLATPPRRPSPSYDSPMLTPSPLRRKPLFPQPLHDQDDIFLQTPFKSTAQAHNLSHASKPRPITPDDDEGAIFLSSASAAFSPFVPPSSSQPLLTPVKQIHRDPTRTALSVKQLNATSVPPSPLRVGVGTKRKSTPHNTPLRQNTLTPLNISSARNSGAGGMAFDRLAPLPAPKFTSRTPHTKAETEGHLYRQTETLTRLRLTDRSISGDEFGGDDDDSGCEMEEDMFLSNKPLRELVSSRSHNIEEVSETISPGGHVTKRRARSRPVSEELLESAQRSPSFSPTKRDSKSTRGGAVAFPSSRFHHGRTASSSSSSSEAGSPLPRRRLTGTASNAHLPKPSYPPRPLTRLESSGSLFFGPTIPASSPTVRSRLSTASSSSSAATACLSVNNSRSKTLNRHSYAGTGCGGGNRQSWNAIQTRNATPSPRSSPLSAAHTMDNDDDDLEEERFFGAGFQNDQVMDDPSSSFMFSITAGTPSPRSRISDSAALAKKYRHRDSGVVVSSDDDNDSVLGGGSVSGDYLNIMPGASTSASSIYSDEGLITPGVGPEPNSGWPDATGVVLPGADSAGDLGMQEGALDRDAFILRTLAAASKGHYHDGGIGAVGPKKKVPGTPVKKVKTSYLAADRPWQSAVAHRVGIDWDVSVGKNGKPRKSLPAVFPALNIKRKMGKMPSLDPATDSEDEDSPTGRREKYAGLGLGRPSHAVGRVGWLMRRSSSGAFSSGSDSNSIAGTPTRTKDIEWHLPKSHNPFPLSPSNNALNLSPGRTTSSSSSGSLTTVHSPTQRHCTPISGTQKHPAPAPRPTTTRRLSEPSVEDPGRFDREFEEIDELGSGEFGKVIKVRSKAGDHSEVYAVKKSKRFEGVRHRLRLREEVEILQHLSRASGTAKNGHSNVLAFVDSWEEDDTLFIRTELCELGNFASFLWEYGRVFPRLDEARVWKIIADLSNGLGFIHHAGVIHLDLKPSNIFITGEGRFKIGDFGMASLWPRPAPPTASQLETESVVSGFEREGDKMYLAPEVLQGRYGKAADVFSFGMTILETASNILVPDQGEAWHRLRREDFSQIDLDDSPELLELIRQTMRTDPALRISVPAICAHRVVSRARTGMDRACAAANKVGASVFAASPLASVPAGFLEEILDRPCHLPADSAMDLSA